MSRIICLRIFNGQYLICRPKFSGMYAIDVLWFLEFLDLPECAAMAACCTRVTVLYVQRILCLKCLFVYKMTATPFYSVCGIERIDPAQVERVVERARLSGDGNVMDMECFAQIVEITLLLRKYAEQRNMGGISVHRVFAIIWQAFFSDYDAVCKSGVRSLLVLNMRFEECLWRWTDDVLPAIPWIHRAWRSSLCDELTVFNFFYVLMHHARHFVENPLVMVMSVLQDASQSLF